MNNKKLTRNFTLSDDALIMETLETELLNQLGYPNPYTEDNENG